MFINYKKNKNTPGFYLPRNHYSTNKQGKTIPGQDFQKLHMEQVMKRPAAISNSS
jgi:hypothetical protein